MADHPQMSAPDMPQLSQQRAIWPTVVGVISIVLACIGILNYTCGTGWTLISGTFLETMAENMSEADRAHMEATTAITQKYMIPSIFSQLLGLVLAIFLLTVGIAILKRRRWSRGGALLWSSGKVVHALVAGAIGYLTTQAVIEMMQSDPDLQTTPQGFQEIFSASGSVVAIMTSLFLLAYPVFIVIWFSRRKVVEEVHGWE